MTISALRPVINPTSGTFWEATLNAKGNRLLVSTSERDSLTPGTYTDILKVHWDGIPDLVTELSISMTVNEGSAAEQPGVAGASSALRQRYEWRAHRNRARLDIRAITVGLVACLLGIVGIKFIGYLSALAYFHTPDPSTNIGRDLLGPVVFFARFGSWGLAIFGGLVAVAGIFVAITRRVRH